MNETRANETRFEGEDREQGSALIVTMVLILMVMSLVLVTSQMNIQKSQTAVGATQYLQLTADAETGIGAKFEAISASSSDPDEVVKDLDLSNGNNTIQVRVVTLDTDLYEVTSTATDTRGQSVTIKATITAAIHPTFRKALYVGNKDGLPVPVRLGPVNNLSSTVTFDESQWLSGSTELEEADLGIDFNGDFDQNDSPDIEDLEDSDYPGWSVGAGTLEKSGSSYRIDLDQDGSFSTYTNTIVNAPEFASPAGYETTASDWDTDHQGDGDYIDGEIHVNGDAELRGNTLVFDQVDATGTIQGSNVPGTLNPGAEEITPPDLHAEDYESLADTIVTTSDTSHPAFNGPRTDKFYGNLEYASNMDNGVIHLGPATSGSLANFDASESGDLVLVKGNLWLHSRDSRQIKLPSTHAVVLTIVVEGNLYIGDDFQYVHDDSAVLFLVKGVADDPSTPEREDESYHDANKNYTYDVGETIINDDGDGIYEGPAEGQGNVFFGDAKYGTGGVTDGYMYAENNAYLMDPSTASDPVDDFNERDKIYGVYGFLSAGGVVDLGNRTLGGDSYFQYKVKKDNRLEEKQVTFKGLPNASGGGSDFTLLAWTVTRN